MKALTLLKKYYGHAALTLLIVLPIVIWLSGSNNGMQTLNTASFLLLLGKAAALSALAAYFLMPILSMRHKAIEKIFGGLDTLYRLHASLGKIIFFLVLAHPVLLLVGGLLNGATFANVWDWTSLLIVSGIIGLVGVMGLTIIAIYSRIKHQNWTAIHRIFGLLIPLLFAHALLARAQVFNNSLLFTYMVTLGLLGTAAFVYRSILGKFLIQKYRYLIVDVHQLTPQVTELVLKPLGIPINYNPGQFAYVSVKSSSVDDESHPFSFTTANDGPYLRFAIKALGDDTKNMKNLKPGTKAYIEGPFGKFSYLNANNKNQIWIAGGVGITPFLSMARSMTKKHNYKIHLFYAANDMEDAVFLHDLIDIRKIIPDSFDLTVVNREISGFVNIEMIQEQIQDLSAYDYLICGPPPMTKPLIDSLHQNGVDSSQIYREDFSML